MVQIHQTFGNILEHMYLLGSSLSSCMKWSCFLLLLTHWHRHSFVREEWNLLFNKDVQRNVGRYWMETPPENMEPEHAPREHGPLLDRNVLPIRTWTVTGWRCPLPTEWKLKNVFWKGVRLFNKTQNLWNEFKFQMSLLLLTSCRCLRKGHEPTSPCTKIFYHKQAMIERKWMSEHLDKASSKKTYLYMQRAVTFIVNHDRDH